MIAFETGTRVLSHTIMISKPVLARLRRLPLRHSPLNNSNVLSHPSRRQPDFAATNSISCAFRNILILRAGVGRRWFESFVVESIAGRYTFSDDSVEPTEKVNGQRGWTVVRGETDRSCVTRMMAPEYRRRLSAKASMVGTSTWVVISSNSLRVVRTYI
jgi:hypothetical protein